MTKHGFVVGLILMAMTSHAQSRYEQLIGRVNLAEDYFEAKAALEELEKISCVVDYYPVMAAKAMNQNHRFEGITFLEKALNFGYTLSAYQRFHNTAFNTLSEVTKDSLINHLELTNSLSFNWRKRQLLESIFTAELVNEARHDCDTNQRVLASALRNLLNQYMRTEGLPSDCEVGYGMKMKSIRLIFNRSHLLFDSEWEQLEAILTTAARNNQISTRLYASMVDTYLYFKFGTMRYGSARFSSDENQVNYVKNHLDEINQARKSIGLDIIDFD
jgi:hypothetical protein